MANTTFKNSTDGKAYIITGPTSGIGRATALELAKHGTLVLVARDPKKLDDVRKAIKQKGGHAVSVVCDLSTSPACGARRRRSSRSGLRSPAC